jgi:hypothetical protein
MLRLRLKEISMYTRFFLAAVALAAISDNLDAPPKFRGA